MRERIKTLLIYADRAGWKATAKDTLVHGVLGVSQDYSPNGIISYIPGLNKFLKTNNWYDRLSYVNDWKDAFQHSPLLHLETCTINNLVEFRHFKRALREYPLVIILHSATGDNMSVLLKTRAWFSDRRGKLLVFIGNEYNLLQDKIRFLNDVGADYIGTQLPLKAAIWLYNQCHGLEIIEAPHALNPKIYRCIPDVRKSVDVGFRGLIYPRWIGDLERTSIISYFQNRCHIHELSCDIRTEKVTRNEWARLLNTFKAVVGAEAGTYYLQRSDELINKVAKFEKANPNVSFAEIYNLYFSGLDPMISGKCISSRHFEPIGTKTCQILVEGEYNGILKADEHFISVKKDLSNINDAIQRFKDVSYRERMVENTLQYVMDCHTYDKRVNEILKKVITGI